MIDDVHDSDFLISAWYLHERKVWDRKKGKIKLFCSTTIIISDSVNDKNLFTKDKMWKWKKNLCDAYEK